LSRLEKLKTNFSAGKNLFKVRKITLEQKALGLCSSVISLTLKFFLPAGLNLQNSTKVDQKKLRSLLKDC